MPARAMLAIILIAAGCSSASTQRPANVPQPEVNIQLTGTIFFGSGYTAPANLDVSVTNRASTSVRLREIEITTPGMMQYALYPYRRQFNDAIAPGETKSFALFATAYTNIFRLVPTEPLSVRAIVDFNAGEARFREIYIFPNVGGAW